MPVKVNKRHELLGAVDVSELIQQLRKLTAPVLDPQWVRDDVDGPGWVLRHGPLRAVVDEHGPKEYGFYVEIYGDDEEEPLLAGTGSSEQQAKTAAARQLPACVLAYVALQLGVPPLVTS